MFAFVWIGCQFTGAQEPPVRDPSPAAAPQPADPDPAAAPADDTVQYWTTSWALRDIDLQTLSKRLELLGFPIPVAAKGTASVNFQVAVPVNRPTNMRAYRFRGSMTGRDIQLDNLVLPELFADIVYDDGVWKLVRFDGKTASGTFSGTGSATVTPPGRFAAQLEIKQLRLGPLVELFGKLSEQTQPLQISGLVDGSVEVSGNVAQIQDFTKWNAQGRLSTKNLSAGRSSKFVVEVEEFSLRDQMFRVGRLAMTSPDHPGFFLRGSGQLSLDQTQRFQVDIAGNDLPTADLLGLYFQSPETWASGKVDVRGTASGQLGTTRADSTSAPSPDPDSPGIEADVLIASPDLNLLGVDVGLIEHRLRLHGGQLELRPLFPENTDPRRKVESVQGRYTVTSQHIAVQDLAATVLGGSIRGAGTLARDTAGVHRVEMKWDRIEPTGQFSLPWMSRRVGITAKTSGSVRWSAPADKVNYPAFHQGDARIKVDSLLLEGESLGSMSVELSIDRSRFSLNADGTLLDGSIGLTSQAHIEPTLRWADLPQMMLGGQLIIRDLSLGESVRVLTDSRNRRFAGRLGGTVDFQVRPNASLQWKSKLALRDARIDQRRVSNLLTADLSQDDGLIELKEFEGDFGGGRIDGDGQWSIDPGNRTIKVRLTRVQGKQLLLPLVESADQWIDGLVSGRAIISGVGTGPLDGVRVQGAVHLIDGQIYGVAIGNAHSPFRIQLNTSPLRWRANFPKIQARFARGNVSGAMEVGSPALGSGIDLESRWRMNHVDFEELLRPFVSTNTIGRGDVTGDLSLSGRRVQSVADLQGRFRLQLGGTDATAVPGLSAAGSTLGVISLAGVRFTSGEANGQISQGAARLERLVMSADRLRIQGTGRVFLDGPRMDVRALIETGNFQGQQLLSQQMTSAAVGSLTPLTSVNRLFSERSFVLDLHGSLADPQIRVLTAETVQANLRRRFIRDAVGLVIGDSILIGD